jgi:hypothetical protein
MAKKSGHPAPGGNPWAAADDYLRTRLPAELETRGMGGTAEMLRALPRVTDAKVLILALPIVAQLALFAYDQGQQALKIVAAFEKDQPST